jgi:hypothetical protein
MPSEFPKQQQNQGGVGEVHFVVTLDFARSYPIPHDGLPRPHDADTIPHDSLTKTPDFGSKQYDTRQAIFNICIRISGTIAGLRPVSDDYRAVSGGIRVLSQENRPVSINIVRKRANYGKYLRPVPSQIAAAAVTNSGVGEMQAIPYVASDP